MTRRMAAIARHDLELTALIVLPPKTGAGRPRPVTTTRTAADRSRSAGARPPAGGGWCTSRCTSRCTRTPRRARGGPLLPPYSRVPVPGTECRPAYGLARPGPVTATTRCGSQVPSHRFGSNPAVGDPEEIHVVGRASDDADRRPAGPTRSRDRDDPVRVPVLVPTDRVRRASRDPEEIHVVGRASDDAESRPAGPDQVP